MTLLYIDRIARERIKNAIARARARPVPWDSMKRFALDPTDTLTLDQRHPEFDRVSFSQNVEFIGGVRAAFSFEEQPAGLVAHLSISTPHIGKLPTQKMVEQLLHEFGFKTVNRLWREEFAPGEYAMNFVELVEPREADHAPSTASPPEKEGDHDDGNNTGNS